MDGGAVTAAPVTLGPVERMVFANPARGWWGVPFAEIFLAPAVDGWRQATAVALDGHGHAFPLTIRSKPHATREAALRAAIERLRAATPEGTGTRARLISAWLDRIDPDQRDLFAPAA